MNDDKKTREELTDIYADRVADFLEELIKRLDYIASAPIATDPSPTPPEPPQES